MKSNDFANNSRFFGFILLIFTLILIGSCTRNPVNLFLRGSKTPGFEQDGPVRVYNHATLFQYMNGEAETYISSGFELLYVRTYMDNETGALISVETYDMGTIQGAEKIYSEYIGEHGSGLDELGEAAWTDRFLILFRRDRFFSRVMPDTAYENEVEPTFREMIKLSRTLDKQF